MSKISSVGSSGGSIAWTTAIDLDFTADPTQTIAPDGNYVIGGFTWTKINSANEVSNMVVTNGVGLVITPVANSEYRNVTRTAPAIRLPVLGLVPTAGVTTRFRAWVNWTGNPNWTANYQSAYMLLENTTTVSWFGLCTRYDGEKGLYVWNNRGGVEVPSSPTVASQGEVVSRASSAMDLYGGMSSWPDAVHIVGDAGEAFDPAVMPQAHLGQADPGGGGLTGQEGAMGLVDASWNFLLGAGRGGGQTAFALTIKKFRVDYINYD